MTDRQTGNDKKDRPGFFKHVGMIAVGAAIGYLLSRAFFDDPILILAATVFGAIFGSGAAHGHPAIEFGNDGDGDGGDGGGD